MQVKGWGLAVIAAAVAAAFFTFLSTTPRMTGNSANKQADVRIPIGVPASVDTRLESQMSEPDYPSAAAEARMQTIRRKAEAQRGAEAISEARAVPEKNARQNSAIGSTVSVSPSSPLRPFFPWPPPVPSASTAIHLSSKFQKLGELSDYLERQLNRAGYSDFRYYGIGADGFALVTRLERIDKGGRPLDGELRWPNYTHLNSIEMSRVPFSIGTYLSALVWPGAGFEARYRLFVTLVTRNTVRPNPDLEVDTPTIRNWVTLGSLSLDREHAARRLTKDHKVTALVYELLVLPSSRPELLLPSPLPGGTHLAAAGVNF